MLQDHFNDYDNEHHPALKLLQMFCKIPIQIVGASQNRIQDQVLCQIHQVTIIIMEDFKLN